MHCRETLLYFCDIKFIALGGSGGSVIHIHNNCEWKWHCHLFSDQTRSFSMGSSWPFCVLLLLLFLWLLCTKRWTWEQVSTGSRHKMNGVQYASVAGPHSLCSFVAGWWVQEWLAKRKVLFISMWGDGRWFRSWWTTLLVVRGLSVSILMNDVERLFLTRDKYPATSGAIMTRWIVADWEEETHHLATRRFESWVLCS